MSGAWNRALVSAALAIACAAPGFARELTFEDRVKAQVALERVRYAHAIGTTRAFEDAVPLARIEAKVTNDLEKSVALARFWDTPLTAGMLEREVRRMTRQTRMPVRLRELFAALGDDPFLIEECLARPALVDRLARSFFSNDPRFRAGEAATPRAWDEWWAQVAPGLDARAVPAVAKGNAIDAPAPSCGPDDTWDNESLGAPIERFDHTAIWTGSEMIVWGGSDGADPIESGGRYDPATDTWAFTSLIGAPAARSRHTAIWTGSEVIVWGGYDGADLASGGRYDPVSDTWTPVSATGAPAARSGHTAIWTGSRMVVWGGRSATAVFISGGRYDPVTDTWSPTATFHAPTLRYDHTAIWTGSVMIVWGGRNLTVANRTGAKYDPAADVWTPISQTQAPVARTGHAAVWTDSSMVVWGGDDLLGNEQNSGGRYDPVTNTWQSTTTAGAPAPRSEPAAVWTGSRMIVWGGSYPCCSNFNGTGGVYDPAADAWVAATPALGAPEERADHTAVWTGGEMVIWGGRVVSSTMNIPTATGARYLPASNSWTPTSTSVTGVPARWGHDAIWTGTEMVVVGGVWTSDDSVTTGDRYDPALDSWTPMSTLGAPEVRAGHSVVWTGTELLLWAGFGRWSNEFVNSGARYDLLADTWSPMSATGAPSPRQRHSAAWTGTRMVIWGGNEAADLGDGGRYDPASDSWAAISTIGAPVGSGYPAVWTGREMLVQAGGGRRYDPSTDTWTPMSAAGAPPPGQAVVWTGREMIVWGGYDGNNLTNAGGRYDPATDTWTPTSTSGAPAPRWGPSAVWTGDRMVVWGGDPGPQYNDYVRTGGRYDPVSDSWQPMSIGGAPSARASHTAVWADGMMIVWGGEGKYGDNLADGGRYFVTIDADGDGSSTCAGDCDDADPAIFPGASETCDGIDDDCDGLIDEDALGVDSDADGVRNACDNCVVDPNPAQSDWNNDSEGDVCDLNDGLILTRRDDKVSVAWQAESGATSWNLYVGDLDVLRSAGLYTQVPGSNALASRQCGLAATVGADLAVPGSGKVSFSLVTGVQGGVEGSLGTNSAGAERLNQHPCP